MGSRMRWDHIRLPIDWDGLEQRRRWDRLPVSAHHQKPAPTIDTLLRRAEWAAALAFALAVTGALIASGWILG